MIAGVDFSGHATDNATWITTALLQGDALEIMSCCRLPKKREDAHKKLEQRLKKLLSDNAIIALDFPFGVPKAFADTGFCPNAAKMSDLWKAAHSKSVNGDLTEYLSTKNGLHKKLSKGGTFHKYTKLKRKADENITESYSPLNTVKPNMLPMTFYGMQMLYRLCKAKVPGFYVDTADDARRTGPLLMEVMPGAALSAFKLPHKTYKRDINALSERQRIVADLDTRSGLKLPNLKTFRDHCMFSDDALDSVVAAVVAAKWASHHEFQQLSAGNSCTTRIEGRIYAPKHIKQ